MATIVPPVALDRGVTARRTGAREPISIYIGDTTVFLSEDEARDLAAQLRGLVEAEETKA